MEKEKRFTLNESHRKFAVDFFNLVWSLLDKKRRTQEEDDRMIHAAHASRFHWGEIGTPLEIERGEWQISRVYSVLKMPHSALFHAKRCLEITRKNNIQDFDLAFAYEALARAYSIKENLAECKKFVKLAQEAGGKIESQDDKDYFFSELRTISC